MTALDALLTECERVGDCVECGRPPATKAEWKRHDREYPENNCPTQSGRGDCWCLNWCWCANPETEGATTRERTLAAIVRVLDQAARRAEAKLAARVGPRDFAEEGDLNRIEAQVALGVAINKAEALAAGKES